MIKNIYTAIQECDDVVQLFQKSALTEGATLIEKVFKDKSEQLKYAMYVCDVYDINSSILGKHKTRTDEKKAATQKNGIEITGEWVRIVNNTKKESNDYITWYFRQTKDIYFEAVITAEELIEYLLEVSRERIDKDRDGIQMGDDKFLKAMELKSRCFQNAVMHIEELKKLKDELQKKYEVADENIKKEMSYNKIVKNSGTGEQIATMAREIKSELPTHARGDG